MLALNPVEFIIAAQGVIYLIVAVFALFKLKANPRLARLLALYSLLSALWMAAQLAWSRDWLPFLLDEFSVRLPLYGLMLLALVFFWFTRLYLQSDSPAWGWGALGLAWIGVLLLLDSNLATASPFLWAGGGWVIRRTDFVLAALALGWCLFTGLAVVTTLQAYRRLQQPLQLNRIRYLAAIILAVFAGGQLFLAALWTPGDLGVLLAAYASFNTQLPSLRRAVLRSLSYVITTGLALGFYLAVLMGARLAFQATTAYDPWQVATILAAILAIVFSPLLWQTQRWLDRLIAGVSHDPRRVLRRYSQTISNILDLGLLAEVVIELIGDALDIRRGWLFTVTHDKEPNGCNCYQLLPVTGFEKPGPEVIHIEVGSPLADYWLFHRAPLAQSEIEASPRFTSAPAEERSRIASLDMELFVPIHSKDEWIGLLALGPKNSGEPFWDDDLFLLSTLADQTAVALENARLVGSLVRLNNDFRRAISALDQANRTLERLDRTKAEFISVASHELRTPLTLVNGYSQLLLDEPTLADHPAYAKMLEGIHSGAQRLHEIVESMLDMARIDSRELQLDLQLILLEELLGGIFEEFKPALSERNQILELHNLASLPPIQGDRELIRKVFLHLITNAIKYTPDGGHITVTGRTVFPTPEELTESGVELVVSDSGIGIDASMQDVIFTKFYQTGELALHSSGKIKFKGAGPGLGLAIAKGIVEAHFGRIWVESPGHDEDRYPGSQFHVFLPLHQPEKTRPRMSA
jgi:signal transduction histidine kinase